MVFQMFLTICSQKLINFGKTPKEVTPIYKFKMCILYDLNFIFQFPYL